MTTKKETATKKVLPKKAQPKLVAKATKADDGNERETATVHVKFDNANAGDSDFTGTHNNQNPQTLSETGDIIFDAVKRGDTIEIKSDSPGDTTVTVSGVNTHPIKMIAVPGQHIADFFVVI